MKFIEKTSWTEKRNRIATFKFFPFSLEVKLNKM